MDAVTGTAGNDTINAPATSPTTGANATTINSGDVVAGGAGDDTLNITISTTNNNSLTGLTVSGVETVNISGTNNLGTSSPALASAQDAKALTAAALAARQAEATLAVSNDDAADAVAVLAGRGVNLAANPATTTSQGELGVVQASTATVASAATRAAAATHFAALIKTELDAYTANGGNTAANGLALATKIDLLATSTTATDFGTIPASGATFAIADVRAVASLVRTAADGTSLTAAALATGALDATKVAAGAALVARNTIVAAVSAEVNTLTQSTLTTDLVANQEAAAAVAVANGISDADLALIAASTTAILGGAASGTGVAGLYTRLNTTDFTVQQFLDAAKATLITYSGAATAATGLDERADELAALKTLVADVNRDFSIAQLNTAAGNSLVGATGASLLTSGDDSVAIKQRADARATATDAARVTAVTAADAALQADVNAANAVTVAQAGVAATSVAATQFADATQIWLSGSSTKTNVTGVAATQTIGFDGVTGVESTVSFSGTSASIASKGATGTVTLAGATLASVSLSGTTAGASTAPLSLVDGNSIDIIKALNVSTTGSTEVNTAGMSALTSVTQTGAGALTVNRTLAAGEAAKLAAITTGAGADQVQIATATAADDLGTSIDETVNASVSTGSGGDRVVVSTSGAGKTTVDLGDGSDTLVLSGIGTGANSLSGGAGNDTFRIGNISTLGTTKIDGGSDTDTLRTSITGTLSFADYTTLSANVSSVETLQLASGSSAVTLDASKVAMSRIEFLGSGTNTVTEVSSSQILAAVRTPVSSASFGIAAVASSVAVSNITAASKGYLVDTDVSLAGQQTAFGDNLNISMTHVSESATVVANANSLDLSVTALAAFKGGTSTTDVAELNSQVTVSGDIRTLNATLTSARGSGTRTDQSSTDIGNEAMAKLVVNGIALDNAATANTDEGNLDNLASIKVSGAGEVTINAGSLTKETAKLTSIDLSGMTAFVDTNQLGQEVSSGGVAGGYNNLSKSTVTLNDNISETVILGGGRDKVVTGSTVAVTDTVTGFQLSASAVSAIAVDTTRSDELSIGTAFTGQIGAVAGGNASKMITTASSLNAALLEAASLKAADGTTNVENVVFHFGGNTYVYVDTGANGLTDTDKLVVLSGTLNLDLLVQTGVIIA